MAALAIGGPRNDLTPGPAARLNPGHPLTRGLMICATPWYDLARGNRITPTSCASGVNGRGFGALLSTSSRMDLVDDPQLHAWTEYTIAAWGSATGDLVVADRDRVTPSPDFGVALIYSSGSITHYSLGATGLYVASGSGGSAGPTMMIAGTAKTGEVTSYFNGVRVGIDTTANGALLDSTNPWTFGMIPWGPFPSAGVLGPVMIWNRVLNPSEILQLYVNPFAMLVSA